MCGIRSALWQKRFFLFPPFLISFSFSIYLSLHIVTMSSCRTTGPSPSRNNGGESIRDSGNVSSTPKLRSRTQIVTPATTTNEQTTSSTKGTGAHRRRSKRGCQSSERLTPPKSYFTDRQGKVTCLMFGLDPSNEAHKRVICVGCMRCVGNADPTSML